jgi:hypothetical protein
MLFFRKTWYLLRLKPSFRNWHRFYGDEKSITLAVSDQFNLLINQKKSNTEQIFSRIIIGRNESEFKTKRICLKSRSRNVNYT